MTSSMSSLCGLHIRISRACMFTAELVAVGSRSQEKANAFVNLEWARGATAYGSYDAVIQDPRVHAVGEA